ncbi:amino acid transporter [Gemmatimonadetes bacterium T265]|nr:amino acid transporter [Gemmatimonadetes bacterium T265]
MTLQARAAPRLVRALGPLGLAAAVVNVTIGGGIFRLPAGAAAALGPAAPLAYLACAAAMALVVLCVAEAGSRVGRTGGLYAYVEVAFGPFVGFVAGVLLYACMAAALGAVSSFLADSLGAVVPALAGGVPRAGALLAVLLAFAAVNVRGLRAASRTNNLLTAAKLVPLALFVAAGAFAVRAPNLAVHAAPAARDVARTATFLIFAFLGTESALAPSGEVRDPARTVPRALLGAIAAVALIYVAVHVVAEGVLGPALATSKTPVADAAGVALGPLGEGLVLAGSIVSMLGYVGGMTFAAPRVLFALGRDGLLPRALAAVHPRYRTPYVAVLAQTAVTAVLALGGAFERLALVANGAALLVYAMCCAAAWELRRRDVREGGGEPLRTRAGAVAPAAAIAVIAWLLSGLKRAEWAAIGAAVVVAVVAYAVATVRRARVAEVG